MVYNIIQKYMEKVLLIDGNSIMNRAFYGIMGNKMLTTKNGMYTNAIYGFLSIMFKNMEEVEPQYMLIAFDSKTAANVRKNMYEGYKKHRHAMPSELAEQMPVIKDILKAMTAKGKKDYEFMLQSFSDSRTELAHSYSSINLSKDTVIDKLNNVKEIVRIMDRILYSHVCDKSGSEYWKTELLAI